MPATTDGRTSGGAFPATYVETADDARRVERAAAGANTLAVDCEAAGYHRYSDRLCLVQLSTPSETFVLDPLALNLTPHLKPLLEDPRRRVLIHGAAYDLRLLRRDLNICVARLGDTQVAASFLGEPAVGLQALLERHLGIRVSKKFQKADWARRPLSREMIDYAAGDTRHLHQLAALLEDRLAARGRLDWATEEYRWLVESATGPDEPGVAPDPVTRVKAARKLDPRDVTALREAIAWRDGIARSLDRAPFRVASDAALLGAVLARPASVVQLARVREFPSRLAANRGRSLLAVLRRVDGLAPRELSPYPAATSRRARRTPEAEAAFERLKTARNRAAQELGLDRGRVMANHLLREVVAAQPGNLADLRGLRDVRRWQVDVLGRDLLNALG
ncbi:MAG: HRDC domain-containing protein [Gemmatimonadetes bacterium]|nr:HRDC domain-containing protein [Gemmatimonadota bacterium]